MKPPPRWMPTATPGLMVDVSEEGIAMLLVDAAHLVHSDLISVPEEKRHGGAPLPYGTPVNAVSERCAAVARFIRGNATDLSDVKVSADHADNRPILSEVITNG